MRRFVSLLLTVVILLMTLQAAAQETPPPPPSTGARRAGTVRLEGTSTGNRNGPIALRADKDGYSADLSIVNDGKEALIVSRIAVRGDAADPRVPSKLIAKLGEGSLPITIAPGTSKRAIVQWTPERGIKQRQLFGHVVVTTSDEASGEVAMGVRGQIPGILGPLESHVLSLLIGVPILAAVVMLLFRLIGKKDDRSPHAIAVGALVIQTILAAYVYRGFAPDVSRADGNDGLQFIEHVVWVRGLTTELFLGVDGIAATTLLIASVVALLAVLPERAVPRGANGYHAALLILDAAAMGAITSMDGLLFLVFASITVVSSTLLVGAWGVEGGSRAAGVRRSAASKLLITSSIAIVLLLIATIATARQADPTFLMDGSKVTTTFSLPELARVSLGAKNATLLGGNLVKVCFVMVLIASLCLLAAFPTHGWLSDVLASAPPATGILVATALPSIGLCAFLRLGCAVLPEGMRWGSGIVVALGAVSAAYGALLSLGQTDLRRMTACSTTCQAGFVLLGAGSLTPQGLSGSIVLGATRALACGVFLLLASAIYERARTSDASRLGGVATQMPGWGTALTAAGLAQAGVLGLGGAWGPMLALLGVLSSYAPLAIAAAIALVVIAAAHLRAVSRVTFGPLDPDWEKNQLLEPFGGKFPDLTAREWTSIAPLVLGIVMLGVWPSPIVSLTTGTVRDLANGVSPPGPDQVAGL